MPAILSNSKNYMIFATQTARNIVAEKPTEPGHSEAIISIVFAACALEAFLTERIDWASQMCSYDEDQPEVIKAFVSVLTDAENCRASLEAKYSMARWVLAGKAYDKGALIYQDFALLMNLRNSLVHLKPSTSLVEKFRSKNVLAPISDDFDGTGGAWTLCISTKAMAEWACNTAGAFILDFIDSVQEDSKFSLLCGKYDREPWADIWAVEAIPSNTFHIASRDE